MGDDPFENYHDPDSIVSLSGLESDKKFVGFFLKKNIIDKDEAQMQLSSIKSTIEMSQQKAKF